MAAWAEVDGTKTAPPALEQVPELRRRHVEHHPHIKLRDLIGQIRALMRIFEVLLEKKGHTGRLPDVGPRFQTVAASWDAGGPRDSPAIVGAGGDGEGARWGSPRVESPRDRRVE